MTKTSLQSLSKLFPDIQLFKNKEIGDEIRALLLELFEPKI
jgi:hypothetical protein